jgi:hypothetical protein
MLKLSFFFSTCFSCGLERLGSALIFFYDAFAWLSFGLGVYFGSLLLLLAVILLFYAFSFSY